MYYIYTSLSVWKSVLIFLCMICIYFFCDRHMTFIVMLSIISVSRKRILSPMAWVAWLTKTITQFPEACGRNAEADVNLENYISSFFSDHIVAHDLPWRLRIYDQLTYVIWNSHYMFEILAVDLIYLLLDIGRELHMSSDLSHVHHNFIKLSTTRM